MHDIVILLDGHERHEFVQKLDDGMIQLGVENWRSKHDSNWAKCMYLIANPFNASNTRESNLPTEWLPRRRTLGSATPEDTPEMYFFPSFVVGRNDIALRVHPPLTRPATALHCAISTQARWRCLPSSLYCCQRRRNNEYHSRANALRARYMPNPR